MTFGFWYLSFMVKIVFFGTPSFILPVLDSLAAPPYEVATVVCAPDKPVGRKQALTAPPAKLWAQQHDIAVLQPEKLGPEFLHELRKYKADVGIIAAYGKIISKAVLDSFPKGILNVHPSLLPRWRGPSPVQTAIAAGDNETGVTIMLTDEKMDHGPILAQKKRVLFGTETGGKLTEQLFREGAELLRMVLPQWLRDEISPHKQEHDKATFSKTVTREDGRLDFTRPAEELGRFVRAYAPWPGTFFETKETGRVKVLEAETITEKPGKKPGTLIRIGQGNFGIVCQRGVFAPKVIQKEGRNPISANDFAKGREELFSE